MDALLQYLGLDKQGLLADTFIRFVKEFDFSDLILSLKKHGDLSSLIENGYTVYAGVQETVNPIITSFSKMKVKKDSTIDFEVASNTYKLMYEKRKDRYTVKVGKYYFTIDDSLNLHCIYYKIRLLTGEDGHVCIKKNIIRTHESKDRTIEIEILRSKTLSQRINMSSSSGSTTPLEWHSIVADSVKPILINKSKYKNLLFREHHNASGEEPSRMELKTLVQLENEPLGRLAIGLYLITGSKNNDFYPRFQAMSGTRVVEIPAIAAVNGTIKATNNKNFTIDNELMQLVQSFFESYVLARERIGLQNVF